MEINPQEFKTFLIEYEKNNPVENWQFNGMDLWPIIKILTSRYINEISRKSKANYLVKAKSISKKTNKNSIIKKVIAKINIIWKTFAYKLSIKPVGNYPFILFGSRYFRVNVGGKYINPFFQPIIDYSITKHSYNPLVCDYYKEQNMQYYYYDKSSPEKFVNKEQFKHYKFFQKNVRYQGDSYLDNFINAIINAYPSLKDVDIYQYVFKKITTIYNKSFIYLEIFKTYKPKYAICLTFYAIEMFSMLYAARQMNVITIDLAHGYGLNKDSIVYFQHHKIPKSGYNTLPNYFWVWDKQIAENFNLWIDNSPCHNVIIGGNTKIYYYINNLKPKRLSDKKVIFLTLSLQLPDSKILESINISGAEYEWWIRLHPSRRSQQSELDDYLSKHCVKSNYNIIDANNKTIFEILMNCDAHLTYNSTAIYDSVFFGNIPLLLDHLSLKYYSHYLRNGNALSGYKVTPVRLLKLIKEAEKRKSDISKIKPKHEEFIDKMIKQEL